jgi:hypothetical protein
MYASQDEMGLHIALATEKSFNEMMESVGISEFHEFEESGVLTEAEGKGSSLKDAFLKFLDKIWTAIKKAYDAVLEFVKKHTDKIKAKLAELASKEKSKFVEKAKKLNDKTKDGKKKTFGKAHSWDGFADVVAGNGPIWKIINSYDNAITRLPGIDYSKTLGKIKASVEIFSSKSDEVREKIKQVFADTNSNAKTDLDIEDLKSATITAKVKELITGEDFDADKKYIVDNASDLFDYGTDFGKTASDVKKNINAVRKSFDTTKRELEAYYRKIHGNDTVLGEVIKNMKQGKLVLTAISNATVSAVRSRCIEASGFVLRVVLSGKVKEATNESAQLVPTAFQTELTSLFDI